MNWNKFIIGYFQYILYVCATTTTIEIEIDELYRHVSCISNSCAIYNAFADRRWNTRLLIIHPVSRCKSLNH